MRGNINMELHSMLLEVEPLEKLAGRARIPSSKPETQRAILAATLAAGRSVVYNDLRCVETSTMKEACRAIGAIVDERDGYLEIQGVGRNFQSVRRVIDALGSGLVFRIFTALTSFTPSATVVTGDAVLRSRVMAPLFDALRQIGAHIYCAADDGKAPIVNWGGGIRGGRCELPGDVS